MPDVVFIEMEKHFYASVDRDQKDLERMIDHFFDLTETSLTNPFTKAVVEETKNKYRGRLKKRMKQLGIKPLKVASDAERIMYKSVNRKKPFDVNGAGTPDPLIWESILILAEKYRGMPASTSARIIYVSKNANDFCEKDKPNKLHPDLLEDLEDLEIPTNVAIIVPLQDNAFDIIHSAGDNDIAAFDLMQFITGKSFSEHDFYYGLTQKILNALPKLSIEPSEAGMPDIYEDPTVDMIHEDYAFEVENVESRGDDKFSIEWQLSVTCTFDIYIPKSEINDNSEISVYDYNWNDHYAAAQIEKNVWLTVYIITDEKLSLLEGFEISMNEERNKPEEKRFRN